MITVMTMIMYQKLGFICSNDNEGKVMGDIDNVNILIMDNNNNIGANIKMQQSIVDFEETNHDAVMTQ